MQSNLKALNFLLVAIAGLLFAMYVDNTMVGLLVTVIFGLYTFIYPKNGILMLFIYVPARPFIMEFNPVLKGIGDMIIFASLAKVLFMYRKDVKELFRFSLFELAFIGFCLVGSIAALLTGVSITAIIFQLRAFVLFYLIFYTVKRLDITKQDVKKFVWTILIMSVLICIHGIIEKMSLREWLLPQSWVNKSLSTSNEYRIYGLPGNPNVLGVFLSLSFAVVYYIKCQLKGKGALLAYIPLSLIIGVLCLTYSRGTWLSFAFGLLVYIIITKNWNVLRTFAVSFAAGLMLISIPVSMGTDAINNWSNEDSANEENGDNAKGGFSDRFGSTFDQSYVEKSSNFGRLYYVDKGFQVFFDSPIIGTGFGTFGDSATLSYGSPIYDDYNMEGDFFSDNQYIQIIAQTGLLGVVLFAVFLLNMMYKIWQKRKDTHFGYVMTVVLLASFAAGVVYNMWEYDVFTLFYFTMLGFILNHQSNIFNKTENEKI